MVAVLVHGNPETPAIWGPLVENLRTIGKPGDAEPILLQLPGFGKPAPTGFGATRDEYVGWLITELEVVVAAHGPVDLVGHDWGGGFTVLAVDRRPDLVRSWASDVLGLFHPDYVWHDFAQLWQTDGAGEKFFADTQATPEADRIAAYNSMGIPSPIADELVVAGDEEMGRCVLALYRSAAQPAMADAGRTLDAIRTRPGLAILPTADPFTGGSDLAPVMAERLGAHPHRLDGQGHWWMLGDPAAGAAMLTEFWGSLA